MPFDEVDGMTLQMDAGIVARADAISGKKTGGDLQYSCEELLIAMREKPGDYPFLSDEWHRNSTAYPWNDLAETLHRVTAKSCNVVEAMIRCTRACWEHGVYGEPWDDLEGDLPVEVAVAFCETMIEWRVTNTSENHRWLDVFLKGHKGVTIDGVTYRFQAREEQPWDMRIEIQKKPKRIPIPKGLRYDLIEDAGRRCKLCYRTAEEAKCPLQIDHIIPVSMGGTNDRDNLQVLCRDCNLGKSNKMPKEAATT